MSKSTFQVKVELQTNSPSDPFKKVFDKRVEIDDSICVPYEKILSSLKFLYGYNALISFCIW